MTDRRRWLRRRRETPVDPLAALLADAPTLPAEPVALIDGAEGHVVIAPGIRLWYRVVGADGPVVIVPGTGNDRELAHLAGRGRQVLYYDVRSRGRSDGPQEADPLGFSTAVSDLEAVRAAFGIERFSIVSCTYLAGVAASYAIDHPDRVERLVLSAVVPVRSSANPGPVHEPPPHHLAHLDQLVASGLRERDPIAFCAAWREVYVPPLLADPDHFDRLAPVCTLSNEWPWNVARSLVFVYAELQSYDWRPQLREVSSPTLIVHGGADPDPADIAREWVDALPDARLLEIADVGRFPWVEAPERFFTTVNRFLAGEPV